VPDRNPTNGPDFTRPWPVACLAVWSLIFASQRKIGCGLFSFWAREPHSNERFLEEVEEEIWKDELVLPPEYRVAHGHDAVAVIDPRNYRFAIPLLLLADVFCCLVRAKHLLRSPA
jgi:hypothetical protein